ncbi:unnamed protein product [Effrenium voratum]|uniref:Uncharacterized protein n=1 Tax=Effrenium voratum TaxID=2562239 RepID=A0AA36IV93_9DINO|nr:unnamed protein product [Effrenium voratum]
MRQIEGHLRQLRSAALGSGWLQELQRPSELAFRQRWEDWHREAVGTPPEHRRERAVGSKSAAESPTERRLDSAMIPRTQPKTRTSTVESDRSSNSATIPRPPSQTRTSTVESDRHGVTRPRTPSTRTPTVESERRPHSAVTSPHSPKTRTSAAESERRSQAAAPRSPEVMSPRTSKTRASTVENERRPDSVTSKLKASTEIERRPLDPVSPKSSMMDSERRSTSGPSVSPKSSMMDSERRSTSGPSVSPKSSMMDSERRSTSGPSVSPKSSMMDSERRSTSGPSVGKQRATTMPEMEAVKQLSERSGRRTSVQKARNIDTSGLKRELSFTSVSLNDVSRAIESDEEPEIDWLEDFWHSVLVSAPAPELKWMAARPLSSWVTIYNRWQAMGNWKPGFAPQYLDAYKMQELLQIPLPKVLEYVKLFDPHQYQKLITTKSALDHSRVKVSVPAFLTSCIVMSTSISKKQKISFLLGCFDENDNLNLDVAQWSSMMLSAFLTGVASFFSVDTEVSGNPLAGRC